MTVEQSPAKEQRQQAEESLSRVRDKLKGIYEKLEGKFVVTEISKEVFLTVLNSKPSKEIGQGSAKSALNKELLIGSHYSVCTPIILWDNLNNYTLQLHYDANISDVSRKQIDDLYFFPPGIQTMIAIGTSRSSSRTINALAEVNNYRNDIIHKVTIELPVNPNTLYTVIVDTQEKRVLVGENGNKGRAWSITEIDLNLQAATAEIVALADQFKVPPGTSFFT